MTKYDIIGDVHGCHAELTELLELLGYGWYDGDPRMPRFPEGRKLVFAGDLVDRGPNSVRVLKIVMNLVGHGVAHFVQGNHDNKLYRYLKETLHGRQSKVRVSHGLSKTLEELDKAGLDFQYEVYEFLESTPTIFETDNLIVVHAAYVENAEGKEARDFHLYGVVDKKAGYDETGFPVRLMNWREWYKGKKDIVVGHIVFKEPDVYVTDQGTSIYAIDTGVPFGGKLTALRYPEMQLHSVQAAKCYWEKGKEKVK